MQNRSGLALKSLVDESDNIISITDARERRYNPQAAFYALPKAFINRLLFKLSGSTLKVFLALVYHTDCWNVIKYPAKITHSKLMKTTGIKKKETISNAYKELEALSIIGGYVSGHGSENTKFYFTFDINHYRTEECCLDQVDIYSYYEMLLTGKFATLPDDINPLNSTKETLPAKPETASVTQPELNNTPATENNTSLNYICTISSAWGTETKLYQADSQGEYLLVDGSFFCDKDEFYKTYEPCIIDSQLNCSFNEPESLEADEPCLQASTALTTEEEAEGKGSVPENGTPSPQKREQGSAEKKDSLITIKSYKINNLIVMAQKDLKFIHEFNSFCTEDSKKYIKNMLYWIVKHAIEFSLSLGDVVDSLRVANEKGKQGKICYLVGIMRNKAENNSNGIRVITKPLSVQAKEYFTERFNHCLEYLESHSFDWQAGELRYTLKNPGADGPAMKEFFKFAVEDIKKAVGISLNVVEK